MLLFRGGKGIFRERIFSFQLWKISSHPVSGNSLSVQRGEAVPGGVGGKAVGTVGKLWRVDFDLPIKSLHLSHLSH